MADDLDAALGLVAVQPSQHVVVREAVALLDFEAFGRPGADQLVVVLAGDCVRPSCMHLYGYGEGKGR